MAQFATLYSMKRLSAFLLLMAGFVLSSCGPLSGSSDGGDGTPFEGAKNVSTYEVEITTVDYEIGIGFNKDGQRAAKVRDNSTGELLATLVVSETKKGSNSVYTGTKFSIEIEPFVSGQDATVAPLKFSALITLPKVSVSENYFETDIPTGVKASVFNCSGKEGKSPFAGGSGAELDPYLICSLNQLKNISATYRLNAYKLMANLAFPNSYNSPDGWTPIGNTTSPFEGSFDGSLRSIDNLQINSSEQKMGLFGVVKNGEVFDLKVLNATVESSGRVGVLVGQVVNSTITNVSSSGTVTSTGLYVGGLIGHIDGDDGICNTQVRNSSSSTNVFVGTGGAGGLVGVNECIYSTSIIKKSFASGNVSAINSYSALACGGLVGYSRGDIARSYATGDISCEDYVGGLVGWSHNGDFSNVYATGNVTATEGNGAALIGLLANSTTIRNSYASGTVTASETASGLATGDGANGKLRFFNSFSVSMMPGTGIKSGLVSDPGANEITMTNSKWLNVGGDAALQCVEGSASTDGCTAASSASEFYGSSSDVTSVWDYDNIWKSNNGAFPTLQ